MSVVIDASVMLASAQETEREYEASNRFLAALGSLERLAYCPALIMPECAGAIARRTQSAPMGQRAVVHLKRIPGIQFVPMSLAFAESAADIAALCRLRGSDACYVALGAQLNATLVTWDIEMLQGGAAVVRTRTPAEWLQEHLQQPEA